MVLGCLTLGVLSSIKEFEHALSDYAVYMEIVMLVWVATEFTVRLWSAGCRSRFQGLAGRLKFLRRPLCIIDMILIMASVTTLVVGTTQERFATSVISGLRFFQILRMVRMDRRGGTWKLLGSVVWAHRQELVTTLYIGMLGLIFSSYFVYLAERNAPRPHRDGEKSGAPPKFSNFADAIWWGVVSNVEEWIITLVIRVCCDGSVRRIERFCVCGFGFLVWSAACLGIFIRVVECVCWWMTSRHVLWYGKKND
ncbi:hypothetical protein BaRGS_00036978 [Batillaria attramentaria]|uniref:Ion transport domain-containing protein n=1 Tax=Batillaria attramentaria TaxID=370345 RepID=A0ABD0JA96_9CAEN